MFMQSRCVVHEDLGGGKFRATIGLRPTQYNKGAGWRDITNAIGATGDPNLTLGVSELVDFRIRPKLSGNAPVLHFGKGNTMVRMTPLDPINVDGVVSGNKISFPGAWPGTGGLIYEIGGHIIRKRIPLLAGHPASFAFRIDDHAGLNLDTLSTPDFRILQPFLQKDMETIPLTWQKSTQGGKLILTAQLPAGNYAGWELDPTLTLQPDATDGIDTEIYSALATTNYGTQTELWVGYYGGTLRSFIKFDLSTLPAGAVISSSILSLVNQHNVAGGGTDHILAVYRQKRAWVEIQATWNIWSTGNNWSTAGGFHADDCEQTDIGNTSVAAEFGIGSTLNINLTPTSKAALDLGNGWTLKHTVETDTAHKWAPSDHTTAAYRPKLVVVYTLPGGGRQTILRGVERGVMRGGI